jgi:pyruvate/2-oxoglutarate dehydrogenase complex dihydrolipoamide acyltransferase (E2) component
MCVSTPKAPEAPKAVAPPAPAPTPEAEEVSVSSAEDTRREKLRRLRSGLASTIKTSAQGVLGTSGSMYDQSQGKTKLGV